MRGSWVFILWLASAVIARAIATAALTVLTSVAVILASTALSAVKRTRREAASPPATPDEAPSALVGH